MDEVLNKQKNLEGELNQKLGNRRDAQLAAMRARMSKRKSERMRKLREEQERERMGVRYVTSLIDLLRFYINIYLLSVLLCFRYYFGLTSLFQFVFVFILLCTTLEFLLVYIICTCLRYRMILLILYNRC